MRPNPFELIIDVNCSKGPDPDHPEWRLTYVGKPLVPSAWPTGKAETLYFYFWLGKECPERPAVFSPNDLFYFGERASVSYFKRGWVPGRKEYRYHWLPRAQNRRVFAVGYRLPSEPGYSRQDKRRSLEYFIARDLVERYGDRHKRFLQFTGRFDFRVAWLRANDVKRDARRILADLKLRYGI